MKKQSQSKTFYAIGGSYSSQEDAIIISAVKRQPDNLTGAFDDAAAQLTNRTSKGVTQRYYNKLRNNTPMHATGNNTSFLVNTKNTISTLDKSIFNAKMRDHVLTDIFSSVPKEALVQFIMDELSSEDKKKMLRKIMRTVTA